MYKNEENIDDVSDLTTRKIWICGELSDEWDGSKTSWTFKGVFSTRDMSVAACKTEKHFIFSAMTNDETPIDPMEAKDLCFPMIEEEL